MADPTHTNREGSSPAATRVGQGVSLEGTLRFTGDAAIEGEVRGRIEAAGTLEVARGASVAADVAVGRLVLFGVARGNVTATGSVEIHPSGQLRGDLSTPALTVHPGALFQGRCDMGRDD